MEGTSGHGVEQVLSLWGIPLLQGHHRCMPFRERAQSERRRERASNDSRTSRAARGRTLRLLTPDARAGARDKV
jgi:hypothetical protein